MMSADAKAWRRLRKRPMQIVDDWLGVSLWELQREIIETLFKPGVRRVAVKSCHGAGKTFLAAVAALTWLYGGQDRIVITTAPTGRQVRKLLWREIRRIWDGCKQRGAPLGGEMPPEAPELKLGNNWFATGFSSNDPVNMQGFHAPGGVLVIMDEANGVHADIWDALQGVMVGAQDRMLAIANPTEASGPFFNLWRDPDCAKFTISALDTPNIKQNREVVPGMVTRAWMEDRARAWSVDSALYRSRVLAEFPENADDALIPLSWMDVCHQRHDELNEGDGKVTGWLGDSNLGVDVARYGPDSSVAARSYATGIRDLHRFRKASIPDTAGWALGLFRDLGCRTARVDCDGLGAGVYDLMALALQDRARAMHFGARANDPLRFENSKAEWAWWLRTCMDPRRDGGPIAMPRNDALAIQLTSCKWKQSHKSGRIQLEPKDDLKKRLPDQASPDEMDAVIYAHARLDWDVAVSVDPEVGYRPNPWTV